MDIKLETLPVRYSVVRVGRGQVGEGLPQVQVLPKFGKLFLEEPYLA